MFYNLSNIVYMSVCRPHLVCVLHPLVVLHRVSVDEGLGEVDVGFAERGLVQCALMKVISCTQALLIITSLS